MMVEKPEHMWHRHLEVDRVNKENAIQCKKTALDMIKHTIRKKKRNIVVLKRPLLNMLKEQGFEVMDFNMEGYATVNAGDNESTEKRPASIYKKRYYCIPGIYECIIRKKG
ncbi:MAG: hypothetical protein GY757_28045 [bacterium]|nr:hypothetical protein [bacterium]